jgi:hypothetical protein
MQSRHQEARAAVVFAFFMGARVLRAQEHQHQPTRSPPANQAWAAGLGHGGTAVSAAAPTRSGITGLLS